MKAKLLVLFFLSVLLTGCKDGVSSTPTATRTMEPTATATVLPTVTTTTTATRTVTPTTTPSPTPTEVPMYIGLPPEDVKVLREQCLQKNPDFLCLPLPFAPSDNTPIEVMESYLPDGQLKDRFLVIEVPAGAGLNSPLEGYLWIRGFLPGGWVRWLNPGRPIEGLSSVSLGWGPFVYYGEVVSPSIILELAKPGKAELCSKPIDEKGEGILFEEEDLRVAVESREVTLGEKLAETGTRLCLSIYKMELVHISFFVPGVGLVNGDGGYGRTDTADLLRNNVGSIVYVLT